MRALCLRTTCRVTSRTMATRLYSTSAISCLYVSELMLLFLFR